MDEHASEYGTVIVHGLPFDVCMTECPLNLELRAIYKAYDEHDLKMLDVRNMAVWERREAMARHPSGKVLRGAGLPGWVNGG